MLVVDDAVRAEAQTPLTVAVVAPPHERAALHEPVPGSEVPDVAVDHVARLDGGSGARAADGGATSEGGLHAVLGRGVGEDRHGQPLVPTEDVDAVDLLGDHRRVGGVVGVRAVEQRCEDGGAAGEGRRDDGVAGGVDLVGALLRELEILGPVFGRVPIGGRDDDEVHGRPAGAVGGCSREALEGVEHVAATDRRHLRRSRIGGLRGRGRDEAEPAQRGGRSCSDGTTCRADALSRSRGGHVRTRG